MSLKLYVQINILFRWNIMKFHWNLITHPQNTILSANLYKMYVSITHTLTCLLYWCALCVQFQLVKWVAPTFETRCSFHLLDENALCVCDTTTNNKCSRIYSRHINPFNWSGIVTIATHTKMTCPLLFVFNFWVWSCLLCVYIQIFLWGTHTYATILPHKKQYFENCLTCMMVIESKRIPVRKRVLSGETDQICPCGITVILSALS